MRMYIHTELCSNIAMLSKFMKEISPEELIQVITKETIYVVIWKSEKENDWR